jgi:hypothetical protein
MPNVRKKIWIVALENEGGCPFPEHTIWACATEALADKTIANDLEERLDWDPDMKEDDFIYHKVEIEVWEE